MKSIQSVFLVLTLCFSVGAHAVGAIAVDDEEGDSAKDVGYNVVGGFGSEGEAKAAALKECRASGNKNCKIGVWYTKCGAYASSKKYSGYGTGASKQIASSKALEDCGDSSCKIVIADCE